MSIYVRAIFAFPSYLYIVGSLSKLAYAVHISSAEGYTNRTFCILCGINSWSKHSDILKKKVGGGYILKLSPNYRAPDNFQVQGVITPYFWKWWVFAYFLCTVVSLLQKRLLTCTLLKLCLTQVLFNKRRMQVKCIYISVCVSGRHLFLLATVANGY